MATERRSKSNINKTNRYSTHDSRSLSAPKSIPEGLDQFEIEVSWVLRNESSEEDENWCPRVTKNKRGTTTNVEWWPALVDTLSYDDNQFQLTYSRDSNSFSLDDLESENYTIEFLHLTSIEFDGWLKHSDGVEMGKECEWRWPRWQQKDQVEQVHETDKCELAQVRASLLDVSKQLREESKMRETLSQRVSVIESRLAASDNRPSIQDRIKRFWRSYAGNGLTFQGRESATTNSFQLSNHIFTQAQPRIRSVDCTLEDFRALAFDVESILGQSVQFRTSLYEATGYNIRRRKTIVIEFETFTDMCRAMGVSRNTMINRSFQRKTDADGKVSSIQIVGQLMSNSLQKYTTANCNVELPETAILVGASTEYLRRNIDRSVKVLYLPRCRMHEQSRTLDSKVSVERKETEEMQSWYKGEDGKQNKDCDELFGFRIVWEYVAHDTDIPQRSSGLNSVVGRLSTIIPVVRTRAPRTVYEVDSILSKYHANLIDQFRDAQIGRDV